MNPIKPSRIFEVFERQEKRGRTLLTRNLVPGQEVYGERLVKGKDAEYREWDVFKSKLAAAILKGAQNVGIRAGSSVLYLGCASGTTVSHVSDMIGKEGVVFAVDLASRVMRDMVFLAERRENIIPIMESASHVEKLASRVLPCDVVYQDLAQRDQVGIFLRNCAVFLKKGGYGLLAVKARSVDVTKKPKQIFNEVRRELEKHHKVIDTRELAPFQKDHCMFIIKS